MLKWQRPASQAKTQMEDLKMKKEEINTNCVDTADKNTKAIKEFISNQLQENLSHKQMSIKELYLYPLGCIFTIWNVHQKLNNVFH